MNQFNLIISTGRDFETQAECEVWFNLMALGDPNPIIFKTPFQGLILCQTSIPPRNIVRYLREIITTKDPDYIQFIQKIYPIDIVTATEIPVIKIAVQELMSKFPICQDQSKKFRITVRKRSSPLKPETIISEIASMISNPVDLKEYDWNLQFEILGNQTGIAILEDNDVFKPISERRRLILSEEENSLF